MMTHLNTSCMYMHHKMHYEKCSTNVWNAAKSKCWDPVTSAAYVIMLFAAAGSNLPPRMSSHTWHRNIVCTFLDPFFLG